MRDDRKFSSFFSEMCVLLHKCINQFEIPSPHAVIIDSFRLIFENDLFQQHILLSLKIYELN